MSTNRKRFVLLLLTVILIFLVRFFAVQSPDEKNSESVKEADNAKSEIVILAASPKVTPSPFLNTSPEVKYVGSQSCVECHAEYTETYHKTRHSRSLSKISQVTDWIDSKVSHSPSGLEYVVKSQGDQLSHLEYLQLEDGHVQTRDASIDFIVGSGAFGHSFLTKLDGFLVQSPLTWYTPRQEWDMSPGYHHADHFGFRRSVSAGCLYCHVGIADIKNNNEFDVSIQEFAIGCERCHGPGSLHVEFHRSGLVLSEDDQFDKTIVNPAHLSRDMAESICQQCHLQGDAKVLVRDRDLNSYRPGLVLSEFRQNYQLKSNDQMTIVGHVDQMHLSKCYLESETLSCFNCHDLHSHFEKKDLDQFYRKACLECHQVESCNEDKIIRQKTANDRCVQCHMPSSPTEIPHVAFTHHRIGIHRESDSKTTPRRSTKQPELIAMLDESVLSEGDVHRCRGLGWLNVALSKENLDHTNALQSAQNELTQAWEIGTRDAAVASGLATIAIQIGWTEKAIEWSRQTLELDESPSNERVSALEILSEAQFNQGKYSESLQGFQELTKVRRNARHWFYLGLNEQNLGESQEAIKSLKISIEINPKNPGAHSMLAAIFHVIEDEAQEQYHKEMAQELLKHVQK